MYYIHLPNRHILNVNVADIPAQCPTKPTVGKKIRIFLPLFHISFMNIFFFVVVVIVVAVVVVVVVDLCKTKNLYDTGDICPYAYIICWICFTSKRMFSININSFSMARIGGKKTLRLLHYPRKIKLPFIYSFHALRGDCLRMLIQSFITFI